MCFFVSLFPATWFLIVAFFVFFAAGKTGGRLQTFGNVLGVWLLILAAFFPICGAYVTASGQCPIDQMMEVPAP